MYIRDTGSSFSNNERKNILNENSEFDYENQYIDQTPVDETDYGGIVDQDALLEAYFIDEISRLTDEQREAFFKSDAFQALYEADILNKRAVVKLNKGSEIKRRTILAAMQKAREVGDNLWDQLRKNRIKEKQLLAAIEKKYANSVKADVKKAMNNFRKLHKATNLNQVYKDITTMR